MEKTRCPYCHEYIEGVLLDAHISKHRVSRDDGQQRDYMTLPPEHRFDGELTNVPVVYTHKDCGAATRMPNEIVRSYLQNPFLYLADATYCVGCRKHVPYADCVWSETGENLQHYFDNLRQNKLECRPAGVNTTANESPVNTAESAHDSSFSMARVGSMLVGLFVVGALMKLPGLLIRQAAQHQEQQAPMNQQAQSNGLDPFSEKIKSGDELPEAVLQLYGVTPERYQAHQQQLRMRESIEFTKQGRFADAVKSLDNALTAAPDAHYLHNNKAWILATCTDELVRSGKLAIEHATKACELTEYRDHSYLDTLAAAYAEDGDFEPAIKHIQAAIELTNDEAQKIRFTDRMDLYKNRQPYRQ